ncbi:hypothetical protein POTOM_013430 [Populus tomentosa]|uniref:DUF1677 family protein n=1 Tax=Populus tomentosa TaxID=118781 RepID=A0A8X8A4S5_POPTO|nr:hypothetical protein POTOM_013430 [Populus tomentosa]
MGTRNGVGCRLSSLQVRVSIAIDGINNFIASVFFISFDNASLDHMYGNHIPIDYDMVDDPQYYLGSWSLEEIVGYVTCGKKGKQGGGRWICGAIKGGCSRGTSRIEVESVRCDCCGLIEECTPAYIERVRERYHGKWICGLCTEAIKYEIVRTERLISTEEAMTKHMNVCKKFVSSGPPPDPTTHLIAAMRQILRRSLDSPRGLRSTPSSPNKTNGAIRAAALARSESCFPAFSG